MTAPANPAPDPARRPSALDPLAPQSDKPLKLRWRERAPAAPAQPSPNPDATAEAPAPRRPRLGLRWLRDPANPYGGSTEG